MQPRLLWMVFALLLAVPPPVLANNASFQFLFPRSLMLLHVPLIVGCVWWFRRRKTETQSSGRGRAFSAAVRFQVLAVLVGWLSGEALWYWERNDLGVSLSRLDSARFCVGMMRFMRYKHDTDPGWALVLEDRAKAPERELGHDRMFLPDATAGDRSGFEEFQRQHALSPTVPWGWLFFRPGMSLGQATFNDCPRGGHIAWDSKLPGPRCSLHGVDGAVQFQAGALDPLIEPAHQLLLLLFALSGISLVWWLPIGVLGLRLWWQ